MDKIYQPDIGESPSMYIGKTGELNVGVGCSLASLQIPSILKPAKALVTKGIRGQNILDEGFISHSDIQLAMGSREIRSLIDELLACPMMLARVKASFNREPDGVFEISRAMAVAPLEKKRLLHQEMQSLIRYAITTRVACSAGVKQTDLDNLFRSQFLAESQRRLIFTKEALDAQWQGHPTLGEEGASLVLDFVPIVGTVKAVAEAIKGRDLITGEKENRWVLAGGIALSLIPFGKLLEKVGGRGGRFILKNLDRMTLRRRWDRLESGKVKGFNFTGKSTGVSYNVNNSGGKYGTYITDQTHIERAIGKVPHDQTSIEITKEQARRLAKNLGVPEDSVLAGGVLNIISRIPERMPKRPQGGNELFKGTNRGLPNYGPELTVHPIPTAGGGGIKQINLRVKDLTDAERKRLSKVFSKEFKEAKKAAFAK